MPRNLTPHLDVPAVAASVALTMRRAHLGSGNCLGASGHKTAAAAGPATKIIDDSKCQLLLNNTASCLSLIDQSLTHLQLHRIISIDNVLF